MQALYNLVAYPTDATARESFFRLAEPYRGQTDGYCLASGAVHPHVTLCQFCAASDEEAARSTELFCGRSFSVALSGVYVMPGVGPEHLGMFWSGYMVRRDAELVKLQSEVAKHLQALGRKCFTAQGDGYFPHLTLARSREPLHGVDLSLLLASTVVGQEMHCSACLGVSDANGQLLKILKG